MSMSLASIGGGIAIVVLVVLVLILLITNIHIVQQSKAYVVERLGAFHTVWNVGLHFKVPFIMRISKKVSLKEQVADFAPQPVITKDNVTMWRMRRTRRTRRPGTFCGIRSCLF